MANISESEVVSGLELLEVSVVQLDNFAVCLTHCTKGVKKKENSKDKSGVILFLKSH